MTKNARQKEDIVPSKEEQRSILLTVTAFNARFDMGLSGILTDAADHTTVPRFQLAIAKWSHQVEEFYMTQGPRKFTTKVSINVKGPGKIHRIHIGTDTAEEIVREHANV